MGSDVNTRTTTAKAIRLALDTGATTYTVRDAQGRITEFYEARATVKAGDPCLRTRFKYVDGPLGSGRDVIATIEDIVAWDATYDFGVQA